VAIHSPALRRRSKRTCSLAKGGELKFHAPKPTQGCLCEVGEIAGPNGGGSTTKIFEAGSQDLSGLCWIGAWAPKLLGSDRRRWLLASAIQGIDMTVNVKTALSFAIAAISIVIGVTRALRHHNEEELALNAVMENQARNCVMAVGPYEFSLIGYQPLYTRNEFCHIFPVRGPIIFDLTFKQKQVRSMGLSFHLYPDGDSNDLLYNDHDLSHTTSKRYVYGKTNIEHTFSSGGDYYLEVHVSNGGANPQYIGRFNFSVRDPWQKVQEISEETCGVLPDVETILDIMEAIPAAGAVKVAELTCAIAKKDPSAAIKAGIKIHDHWVEKK